MNVLIISWNLDSTKPDQLTGTPETIGFLDDSLRSVDSPDIIVFGLQELIDLESRKIAAKTVLLGNKTKTADGGISQKVTTAYKKWFDRLVYAVRLAMPANTPYTVIHSENLVGLFSVIMVKNTERNSLKNTAITTIKRGMGGRYGNKVGPLSNPRRCAKLMCMTVGWHHLSLRHRRFFAVFHQLPSCSWSDACSSAQRRHRSYPGG